jgi:uncharacterized protein (DUF1501 family)
MSKKTMNRRKFLGLTGCAAMGTTTFFSSIANLSMANALAMPIAPPPPNDYKALVCILLSGGNDSFNMLVPRSTGEYAEYSTARSNLALSSSSLHNLNFTDTNGKQFGVHGNMPEVAQMFNNNKLSFISNVGTLIEPTSVAQYNSGNFGLPLGLYSHADQIQQWQTSIPNQRSARGWGGKMADIMNSVNNNPDLSMSISLAGTNIFQQGNNTIEFSIENYGNGSKGIELFESTDPLGIILKNGVQNILEQNYQDIFKKTFADRIKNSQSTHEVFSSAIGAVSPFATNFSASKLSQDLKMVAKTIAASDTLGMHKQPFFVNYGGWDHHHQLLNNQENMLSVVSKAMSEFQATMEELNIDDKVTTFTISDFARTLTSNGNGTDHAWGGNVMVMGGDINGGQVFGEYPDLALNSGLDLGGGLMLPTTSTDEYFAELALWFGVSPSDLINLLPNIGNFYFAGSITPPVGFMNI